MARFLSNLQNLLLPVLPPARQSTGSSSRAFLLRIARTPVVAELSYAMLEEDEPVSVLCSGHRLAFCL